MHRGLPFGERVDAALAIAPVHFHQRRGIPFAHAVHGQNPRSSSAATQDVLAGNATVGPVRRERVGGRPADARGHIMRNSPGRVSRSVISAMLISCANAPFTN